MKKHIIIILIPFIAACGKQQESIGQELTSMYDSPNINKEIAMENPYQLTTTIDNGALITSIKLNGGSFFVSPHAKGDFLGKFSVSVPDNEFVSLSKTYKETPQSAQVFDPHQFVNGPVNWVAVNTQYNQELEVKSSSDFKVSGLIRFTIEPRCTLEEIPFDVIQKDGLLSVVRYPRLDKSTCGESAPDDFELIEN